MANIRDLKRDINYVLGDILDAVYIVEAANKTQNSKEGSKIIDKSIATFDKLMSKVNNRKVENRQKHLKAVRVELEQEAKSLVEELNKLGS